MAVTAHPGDPAEVTERTFEEAQRGVADTNRNYRVDPSDYPVHQLTQEQVDAALEGVEPPAPEPGPGPEPVGGGDQVAESRVEADADEPAGVLEPPPNLKGAALAAWRHKHQPE